MKCLNCRSELEEEVSFLYCPHRACWKHLGFIFHIPKDVGYAKDILRELERMWDTYEKEATATSRQNKTTTVQEDQWDPGAELLH